jgi:hypothetical protein
MMSEPSAFARRAQRWMVFAAIGYFFYLLLLGPMYGLAGREHLNFIPDSIGRAFVLPAAPIWCTPGLHEMLRDYLDWWYHDPCDPYSSPDWK